jgi:hypothetical protein
MARALHTLRLIAFYGLSLLFTVLLSLELFAHLLLPTPVLTQWAAPHHLHAAAHAVATALLIPAVAVGLHPRLRSLAALQSLLLVVIIGLVVSVVAWQGFRPGSNFPTFNFTLYGIVAVLLLSLHPKRDRLFARGRAEPMPVIMALIASVPLLTFAASEIVRQWAGDPVHSVAGHYALTASLAVALAALAGLAAFRTDGWRLPHWSAGIGVAALGLVSIVFPSEASSFGLFGGLAGMAWGIMFIGLGTRRVERPADPARSAPAVIELKG